MARILCNVAGGGKPLKGNAETGDVLAGKTFSNKQSNALTGSMPNNGAWSASTSGSGSVTIPAGYHNGRGTVSGATSYSNGYSNGVSAADGRVNTSSASYNSGYANGVTNGKSVNAIGGCLAMAWWNTAISNSNPSPHTGTVADTTQTLPPGTYVWAVGQKSNYANNDGCWIEVNGSRIAYVNNSDNNDSQQSGKYTLTSSAKVRCRAGEYNGWGFAAFVRMG